MDKDAQKLELERRALQVLEEALDKEPEQRLRLVETRCVDDPLLHSRVTTLLERETEGELQRPTDSIGLADVVPEMCEEMIPGGRIGAYELVRPVARGGMGWVFEAIQDTPHRRVALKILRRGFESEVARGRFELESEVLAFLKHPGIAQVYEAGVHIERGVLGDSPMPFLALEFVEDAHSITSFADGEDLDLGARIQLFLAAADAIHYGHQKGVIHRDIKPANILVSHDGKVKVIDFGIARVIKSSDDSTSGFTRTGQILGTLGAMSPEQFGSDPKEVDVRSDVYSLGVVLYQLLTGERPFDLEGKSVTEVADIVRAGRPTPPRSRRSNFPIDLEAILLKCLRAERELRYGSVMALMEDLHRFLHREPVRARAPGMAQRLGLFVRRNPVPVGLVAALVLVLSLATAVSVNRMRVAQQATREAELATAKAEEAKREAEASNRAMLMAMKQAEEASQAELEALVKADEAEQAERVALEKERNSKVDLAAFEETVMSNSLRRLASWGVDLSDNNEVLPIESLGGEDEQPGSYEEVQVIAKELLGYPEGSEAYIRGRYVMALIGTRDAQLSMADGDFGQARGEFEEARQRFLELNRAFPKEVVYAMGLADVTASLGMCAASLDEDSDFLEKCFRESLWIAEGLAEYSVSNSDCIDFINFTKAQLGASLGGSADEEEVDEAIVLLDECITSGEERVLVSPLDPWLRAGVAFSKLALASVLERREEYAQAEEVIASAYETLLVVVDEVEDPVSIFLDMVMVNSRRAGINLGLGGVNKQAGREWMSFVKQAEASLEEASYLIVDCLAEQPKDEFLLAMQASIFEDLEFVRTLTRGI